MSVSNVTGVARVVPAGTAGRSPDTPTPPTAAADAARESSSSTTLVQVDENTQQPVPPRFPWLSRLARELEPASKQPSPYGSVPILGEKLDKTA